MANVSEMIPEPLRGEVEAALAWFNASQQQAFEVTGIVDAEASLSSSSPRELRLVLCGGDACLQKTFLVSPSSGGFDVQPADPSVPESGAASPTPAELDPPPGARRHWLDAVLPRHKFTVLVFYRGFW